MPLPTFVPPVGPSPGTNQGRQIKLKKAEFGDGYTQASPDGLNHIRRHIELSWEVLSAAQAKAIDDFFTGRLGCLPFYYTPTNLTGSLKWTCEEWSVTVKAPYSATAKLVQSFTLEV